MVASGLLWHALGICPGEMVAFTGGGGKTALALRVARELMAVGRPTVFTSTASLDPVPWMTRLCLEDLGADWLEAVAAEVTAGRPVCLGSRWNPATGKVAGITPEAATALKQLTRQHMDCVILVETGDSGGCPLAAPAQDEPAIPPGTDLVVPVAGAGALGQPLTAAHAHRPEVVAALTGAQAGDRITPAVVAAVLVSDSGCTRGTPAGARVVPVLSQADLPGTDTALRETAALLLGRETPDGARVGRVVLAAPRTPAPVRAVIGDTVALVLAGGASRRFGGNKLLHCWGEASVLEVSLQAPLKAGLKEIVVVTGAYHEVLAPMLARYPVQVVPNPDWAEGMSTSIRAGLRSFAEDETPAAAIICLGDMPLLPPVVLTELARVHAQTGAPIVAPVAGGSRRNPVLFDRRLFPLLLEVRGDKGGRSVVQRYREEMVQVPFPEEDWFRDVDSPADLPEGCG